MIKNIVVLIALVAGLVAIIAAVVGVTAERSGQKNAGRSIVALALFDDPEKVMDKDVQGFLDYLLDKTLRCTRAKKIADKVAFVAMWVMAIAVIVRMVILLVAGA